MNDNIIRSLMSEAMIALYYKGAFTRRNLVARNLQLKICFIAQIVQLCNKPFKRSNFLPKLKHCNIQPN